MDTGQKYTEIVLLDMEKELGTVYSQASKDVQKKLDNYLLKFEAKDIAKQELLAKGEITEAEYKQWRTGQVMISKRWEEMEEVLSRDMTNVNVIASSIINDHTPEAYAIGMNYGTFTVEKGSLLNTSFSLYDRNTVERLMRDDPDLLPKASINIPKDRRWNKQHINSAVLQGVLQGEDIRTVSKRLQSVTDMNRNSAIRNARTMMTSAENGGRMDSYRRAESMGIKVEKQWLATPDGRTRHSHAAQDGEHVPLDEEFANGLMFPGDMDGDSREVYNCRCTMVAVIEDAEGSELPLDIDLEDMDYEDWLDEHEDSFYVAEGSDISETWVRRESEFQFEIEDVINAQGFDGVPRVVSPEEFDEAVKRANGGNGFIAQRTYSAPEKEILDAYRDQLYHGKWYVDCSTGGAQYGRGMYCAADYSGELTAGIRNEMLHYQELGESRFANMNFSQRVVDVRSEDAQKAYDAVIKSAKLSKNEDLILRANKLYTASDADSDKAFELLMNMNKEERSEVNKKLNGIIKKAEDEKVKIAGISIEDYANMKGIKLYAEPVSYTETMTLDPSAKVVNYDDLVKMKSKERSLYAEKYMKSHNFTETERAVFRREITLEKQGQTQWQLAKSWENSNPEEYDKFIKTHSDVFNRHVSKISSMDDGAYAALKGYDAIDASGHGESGSYTVILNRTKVIFKGEKK